MVDGDVISDVLGGGRGGRASGAVTWGEGVEKAVEEAWPKRKKNGRQEHGAGPRSVSPVTPGQHFTILGIPEYGDPRAIRVVAGESAPTIVEPVAKYAKLARYGRTALTVFEGYEPAEMTLPIRFENLARTAEQSSINLEDDIADLEWMAGRTGGTLSVGEPPLVEVFDVILSGATSTRVIPLIPASYQGNQWVITGLTFDANPVRDAGGGRLRQLATLTLCEFVGTPGAIAAKKAAGKTRRGHSETKHATAVLDSLRRIALKAGIHTGEGLKEVLKANPGIRSADRHLKPGTAVKIPATAIRQRPR